MAVPSKIVRFDTLRSLAFGSISGAYANLGTAFTHIMRIIRMTNNTNADITVSFDGGTTDHDIVPAGGFVLYDMTTNQENTIGFYFQDGTQVAIKGSPGSGTFYLTCVFGQNE